MQFNEQSRIPSCPGRQAYIFNFVSISSLSEIQAGEVQQELRTGKELWNKLAYVPSTVMTRRFPCALNISVESKQGASVMIFMVAANEILVH